MCQQPGHCLFQSSIWGLDCCFLTPQPGEPHCCQLCNNCLICCCSHLVSWSCEKKQNLSPRLLHPFSVEPLKTCFNVISNPCPISSNVTQQRFTGFRWLQVPMPYGVQGAVHSSKGGWEITGRHLLFQVKVVHQVVAPDHALNWCRAHLAHLQRHLQIPGKPLWRQIQMSRKPNHRIKISD